MILFADAPPYLTHLFLGLMAATIAVLLIRVQRYYRQNRGGYVSYSPSAAPPAPPSPAREAPADVARWEVQMHDTARQLTAQIDTKMRLLEELIREADRVAARLEAATAGAPLEQRPASQADRLRQPTAPSAPPAGQPTASESEQEPSAGSNASSKRRHEEIYTLADYGYDAAEIARRVGSPVGEVQLILALRQKG